MTHFELCKKTAERFVSSVALFEVSMLGILEKPDVLDFNSSGRSTLYEIKMSRSDFLADRKKIFSCGESLVWRKAVFCM